MISLLQHEITKRWIAILAWGIGLGLFGSMYVTIYPEIADQMAGLADLSIYQAMGVSVASFAGYIASVIIGFLPLILGVYVIITSTGTLAGEEDNGTLEMLLAMPIPRWQIVAMKALGIAVAILSALVIMGGISAASLVYVKQSYEVNVTAMQLFVAIISGWTLLMAFTTIGLFFSALLPNRRIAVSATAAVFITSYFGENMFAMTETLDPYKVVFPHTYFDSTEAVFTQGVQLGDVAVLLMVTVVFFALAILAFDRRNVTVGNWFWQRASVPSKT